MHVRKLQCLFVIGLLASAGSVRAAEISVADLSMVQGTTADVVVSGSITNAEPAGGYSIVLELIPQAGATGIVTFTPVLIPSDVDISELLDPFPAPDDGGSFSRLDTDTTLSLLRNSANKLNAQIGTPIAIDFAGQLASFPVVASATAAGVWDVKLLVASPPSSSAWNPSGTVTTTLIEGTITVTIPFCNADNECDDGNFCTTDTCTAGNCVFTNNTLPCDDADECTVNDICGAGTCAGSAPDCSAFGDQCNTASCTPGGAAGNCTTLTPTTGAACTDLDACTTNDTCSAGGLCVGGAPPNCDDGNVCTDDSCNTAIGCVNTNNTLACDDGDLCTTTDTCSGGSCAGLATDCTAFTDQCNVGVCNAGTGVCGAQPVVVGTACDDQQDCSENDTCNGAGNCTGTTISGCQTCTIPADCTLNPNATCHDTVCNPGTLLCEYPSNGTCPTLSLTPDAFCYDLGTNNTVTVSIDMSGMTNLVNPIIAGQFYLEYDTSTLSNPVVTVGDAPFSNQLLNIVDTPPGTIDYMVAAAGGGTGTFADTTMARITFTTTGQCDPFVQFRTHSPATRVVDSTGTAIEGLSLIKGVMTPIRIDGTVPVFNSCQAFSGDITVNAAAGEHQAVVAWDTASATDSCEISARAVGCTQAPVLCNGGDQNGQPCITDADCLGAVSGICDALGTAVSTGLSGDTLVEGRHTISCTASDSCAGTPVASQGLCTFDVTVLPNNEMIVDIELGAVTANPIRCITFELSNCNDGAQPVETVEKQIGFTNGVAAAVSVLIPSGVYTCITARDRLHTLQETAVLTDDGLTYSASFATTTIPAGTALRGGDFNDDGFIDIIDWAIMNSQFNTAPGANTTCLGVSAPVTPTDWHADVDGDGAVLAADFTFLSFNFGAGNAADCCVITAGFGGDGPVMQIAVWELQFMGLGQLAGADLNDDGWVDMLDVEAFAAGDVPVDDEPVAPVKSLRRRGLRKR